MLCEKKYSNYVNRWVPCDFSSGQYVMFFNSSTGILADISNVCPKDIDV